MPFEVLLALRAGIGFGIDAGERGRMFKGGCLGFGTLCIHDP